MASGNEMAVYLSDKRLSAIPQDVLLKCNDIQSLDLSRNPGIQLRDSLRQFQHLRNLELQDCKLHSIPDDIGELTELEELRLCRNNLSGGLPTTIGQLRRLKILYLSECKLRTLTVHIGELEQLEKLNLSNNSFAGGLSTAIGRLRRLKKLNLERCQLKTLIDDIEYLEQLEKLNLSNNNFAGGLSTAIGRLRRLKKLDLERCQLKALSDDIGYLEELEILTLSNNNFSGGLPSAIWQLRRLRILNLRRCQLKTLSDDIGYLGQLEELNLRDNNFSGGLPPAVGRLHQLRKLNLMYCQLSALTDEIGELKQLKDLQVGTQFFNQDKTMNRFSMGLNPAVGRLAQIQILNLEYCDLTSLPDSIGNLEHLKDLNLTGNNFSSGLGPAIGRLHRLKSLQLSRCQLTTLPENIGDLEKLTKLYLFDNHLQDYPRCTLRLKALKELDLANISRDDTLFEKFVAVLRSQERFNCIKQLPVELAYTNLGILNLRGNPITEPPEEIWSQGIQAIKSFMRALMPGGALMHTDTLNIIGDTGAGKTSVAQSLVERKPCPTASADHTQVLQQLRMTVDNRLGHSVIINDFGGHEIYHSVMPIFLPAKGLVMLVLNINNENHQEKIKKWLHTAIAKSNDVRIIIVGTHADKVIRQRSDIEKRLRTLSSSVLQSAIDEISAHISDLQCRSDDVPGKLCDLYRTRQSLLNANIPVVVLSCLETKEGLADKGLSELYNLVENSLRKPTTLPLSWCRIMIDILNYDALYMTMKQVEDICAAHCTEADDSEARRTILRYLSETSQVIWLANHKVLCDYVFHSPSRIIDICKNILCHDNASLSRLRKHLAGAVEDYENGTLTEPLLRMMLCRQERGEIRRDKPDTQGFECTTYFNVVVNFLQQFNIITCVKKESEGKRYIIPYKLSPSSPAELEHFESKGSSCLNRVVVELSFIGSMIPTSFFETSMSLMLTVSADLAQHYIWRDGLIILRDGVYLIVKRRDPVITVSAFSEARDPSPWNLLYPVLKHLHETVTWSWHGAPPQCAIVCPCCVRHIDQKNCKKQVGQIKTDLTTMVIFSTQDAVRPTCKNCAQAIPRSLCFPTVEKTGSFINDHENIEDFFLKVDQRHESVSENESSMDRTNLSESALIENLRLASDCIAESLTDGELSKILLKLHASKERIILTIEKEDLESERAATRRATKLLEILQKKGSNAIWTFEQVLREIGRPELASMLISGKLHRR